VVGFVGLHAVQRRRYGWLGTAGLATALVGFTLITAGSVGEFWVYSDQPYAMANGRDASWALFLLGHPVLAIGALLFAVATTRAKVFPQETSMMLAVLGLGVVVPYLGAVIFALPFVWMGYLVWSGQYAKDQQSSRVS
jgi:drug/metabolite transporter (DMT)-like permease